MPINAALIHRRRLIWARRLSWALAAASSAPPTPTQQARSGRRSLKLQPSASGLWVRPNEQLPVAITQGQRVYVEGWAKAADGQARAAIGWYTANWYLFKAALGQPQAMTTSYSRFKVDDLPPAAATYAHFQVGTLGHTTGDAYLDDILAFGYVLPVVLPSTLSQTSNYVRMQDQGGVIWHLGLIEGWPGFDNEITQGTQINTGQTWAWIRRTSPNLTNWYLYPSLEGQLTVSTVQPAVGSGSTATIGLIDKYTWLVWDLMANNDGIYGLTRTL